MRIIVNENVSGSVIRALRDRGHDVPSVKESMRSERDEAVLARAQAEQRVVVTHDKDFGELAFRLRGHTAIAHGQERRPSRLAADSDSGTPPDRPECNFGAWK